MKRFILASLLAAFACAVSVQAGDDCCEKTCDQAKAKAKAKLASTASACCAKEAKARVVRKAPEKGAMLLVRR